MLSGEAVSLGQARAIKSFLVENKDNKEFQTQEMNLGLQKMGGIAILKRELKGGLWGSTFAFNYPLVHLKVFRNCLKKFRYEFYLHR